MAVSRASSVGPAPIEVDLSGALDIALQLYLHGQLSEAEAVYRQVLEVRPNEPDALHMLGVVAHGAGDHRLAVRLITRAVAWRPSSPVYRNNLGEAFKALGKLDDAIRQYDHAISLDATYAPAHNGLGVALAALGEDDDAADEYAVALTHDPEFAEAHGNLGVVLARRGELDGALERYRSALATRPGSAEYRRYVSFTLFALRRFDELRAFLEGADISTATGEPDGSMVIGAITEYLAGDLAACRASLDAAAPLLIDDRDFPYRVQYETYVAYIGGLLDWRAAHPERYAQRAAAGLHLIGDSHTLAAAALAVPVGGVSHRVIPELVIDCTAYRLGRAEPNQYKRAFEIVVAGLADGAKVAVTAGEIDCRLRDGIHRQHLKHPEESLDASVRSVVNAYVDYVVGQMRPRGMTTYFCGVPAPNIPPDRIAAAERDAFLRIRRRFNTELAAAAARSGCEFIDVLAITVAGDGFAKDDLYLDEYHYTPAVFDEAMHQL